MVYQRDPAYDDNLFKESLHTRTVSPTQGRIDLTIPADKEENIVMFPSSNISYIIMHWID